MKKSTETERNANENLLNEQINAIIPPIIVFFIGLPLGIGLENQFLNF